MDFHAKIEEMPDRHVAFVRHVGPYAGIGNALSRIFSWAESKDLLQFPQMEFLTAYHDSLQETDDSKLRSDACLTVKVGTEGEDDVATMMIPGGLFAVGRVVIDKAEFREAWERLVDEWIPSSEFEPDTDRIRFELYLNDPDQHPEKKFIVAICQPVRPL